MKSALGSGQTIYPEKIEAHYERSPFIKEICVLVLTGPRPTGWLHGLVRPDLDVIRGRRIVNIRQLLRFEIEGLSVELPPHERLVGYDITLDELPRTTTGELKRLEVEQTLRARHARAGEANDRLSAEDAAWAAQPAVSRILDAVRTVVKPGGLLPPDAHLELDLGLDSMERVELLMHVSQALGADLIEEAGQGIFTLRDLVERVSRCQADNPPTSVQPWQSLLAQTPADDPFLRELDKHKRVRSVVFFALMKAIYLTARVTCGFSVREGRRLPARGPYLISPNHQSYIDSFLVVAALPFHVFRQLFFVGASELRDALHAVDRADGEHRPGRSRRESGAGDAGWAHTGCDVAGCSCCFRKGSARSTEPSDRSEKGRRFCRATSACRSCRRRSTAHGTSGRATGGRTGARSCRGRGRASSSSSASRGVRPVTTSPPRQIGCAKQCSRCGSRCTTNAARLAPQPRRRVPLEILSNRR